MEKRKVVIVGASHGGHEAAFEILNNYENVDVTLLEQSDYVSFMSCGMKLYLEGKTTGADDVRNFRPEDLKNRGGHMLNNTQATDINTYKKTVSVKDLKTGETKELPYDKLIISSGVNPASLDLPGIDLKNVFLMRGYDWAQKINDAQHDDSIKNVAIIGAGNGIAAAEVMRKAGKNVTLIDAGKKPLENYLNDIYTDEFEKVLTENNINLAMETKVEGFTGSDKVEAVKTNNGEIKTDLVIIAVGVTPNTAWLDGTVDLYDNGYIKTDEYFRTNVPDIYAIGDAIFPFSIPANRRVPIPSAIAARHEAQYVVEHLFETTPSRPFAGIVGAQVLEAFGLHAVTTGINLKNAKRAGINAKEVIFKDSLRPDYIPAKENPEIYISLVYNADTHQVLGGSTLSTYDITGQANVLSLAIRNRLTLEDLAEADFFFSPTFDRQWNIINLVAQKALSYDKIV
ncbi:MAG: FAD-dependent oxidoreductase [Lactobacillus sp.]|nr:FAD-dependent oxidoreductase [Lactobacillus sp.]